MSYYEQNGKYTKELNELTEKLVPSMGSCETLNGELIRAVNRIYYEYFNNGNCNAAEWVTNYDYDYGEDEEVIEGVTEFYDNMLRLIEKSVPSAVKDVQRIRNIITDENGSNFSDEELKVYDDLVDNVVEYVLSHENDDKNIPDWY